MLSVYSCGCSKKEHSAVTPLLTPFDFRHFHGCSEDQRKYIDSTRARQFDICLSRGFQGHVDGHNEVDFRPVVPDKIKPDETWEGMARNGFIAFLHKTTLTSS